MDDDQWSCEPEGEKKSLTSRQLCFSPRNARGVTMPECEKEDPEGERGGERSSPSDRGLACPPGDLFPFLLSRLPRFLKMADNERPLCFSEVDGVDADCDDVLHCVADEESGGSGGTEVDDADGAVRMDAALRSDGEEARVSVVSGMRSVPLCFMNPRPARGSMAELELRLIPTSPLIRSTRNVADELKSSMRADPRGELFFRFLPLALGTLEPRTNTWLEESDRVLVRDTPVSSESMSVASSSRLLHRRNWPMSRRLGLRADNGRRHPE